MTGRGAVSVLEGFYDSYRSRNWSELAERTSPGAVWRQAASLPWAGEWKGADGFAAMMARIADCATLTVTGNRSSALGADGVLVEVEATFTARSSGRSLNTKVLELYRLRDGLVDGADAFYLDTHALQELLADRADGAGPR
ncbi:nuclear transport factor 2 family protein [Pseudonocardia sp. GCM10023141]|uniref:nuclear transport factor 2 family protein n=1 Tax=Pseudonocardia sp. GCM10023141 TaxID=3252653 RepID=UPI00360BBDC7